MGKGEGGFTQNQTIRHIRQIFQNNKKSQIYIVHYGGGEANLHCPTFLRYVLIKNAEVILHHDLKEQGFFLKREQRSNDIYILSSNDG